MVVTDPMKNLWWYAAQLTPTKRDATGIVDGDTAHITIDRGFYEYSQKIMRVANVNAPEMNTQAGKDAKQFAIAWFAEFAPDGFVIHTHLDPTDKYGRCLAMIYAPNGQCYNDDIVAFGYAVPFEVEPY